MLIQNKILINRYTAGALIRWYFNGWHHWLFSRRYEITDAIQTRGIHVTEKFSQVSRIEEPTSKRVQKFINIGENSLTEQQFEAIRHILHSEAVDIYINNIWTSIEVQRGTFTVRRNKMNAFDLSFTAEIKDMPVAARLYLPPEDIAEPDEPVVITLDTKTGTASTFSINSTGGENVDDWADVTEYGIEYRKGTSGTWTRNTLGTVLTSDGYTTNISGLDPDSVYQYRAYVKHNVSTFYGDIKQLATLVPTITLGFGSQMQTFTSPPANATDRYVSLSKSGMPDGTRITVDLNVDYSGSGLQAYCYYRVNGLYWVLAAEFFLTDDDDVTIPLTGSFEKDDIVHVRLRLYEESSGSGTLTATITGGTVTQGAGNIVVGSNDEFEITR